MDYLKSINNEGIDMPDHNLRYDIDPMLLSRELTLICGPKQSLENAKSKAQQTANNKYVYIKLLDKDSKFICYIYPTISKKEYDILMKEKIQMAVGRQFLQRLGQSVNQKEIGD